MCLVGDRITGRRSWEDWVMEIGKIGSLWLWGVWGVGEVRVFKCSGVRVCPVVVGVAVRVPRWLQRGHRAGAIKHQLDALGRGRP